jgi:hypothetical protein
VTILFGKKRIHHGGSHNLFGKCNTEIAKQYLERVFTKFSCITDFAKQYSGGFSSRQIFNVKVLLKGLPNNIEDYPRPEVVKVLLKKKLPFRVAFRLVGVLTFNV